MQKLALLASLTILTSCGSHADSNEGEVLSRRLSPWKGDFKWHVSERRADGKENRQCFTVPHGGMVLFWPSRHAVSFAQTQGSEYKTVTVSFASKPEHDIVFDWDRTAETLGLFVDRTPAQKYETVSSRTQRPSCPF